MLREDARLIEAVLFLENQMVTLEHLAKTTGLAEVYVTTLLDELKAFYDGNGSAIELVEESGSFAFTPKRDMAVRLRDLYDNKKIDRRLSKSAIETLAIVAYQQPVTRSEITKIRGVNSDNIVKVLTERDFIKKVGRKDVVGHPWLYGTTRKFLSFFKLGSISDLPKLSEIDAIRFEDASVGTSGEEDSFGDGTSGSESVIDSVYGSSSMDGSGSAADGEEQ